MQKEIEVLDNFIRKEGLRHTPQRESILRVFLGIEKHLSVDELYKIVKKRNPEIGYVTVYRTMKVLEEAGLCNEIDFGDGISRFEHQYGHGHHDHLVCLKCGSYIEVKKPEIEKLQDELAKENSFTPLKHRLQIFGTCKKCLG
ncbi:MAG: transcriptional repressor [Candidatus Omnitrophica bacterium]|nr:transcriptional repressor [Candidatus Omnitrophota bacterium]